MALRWSKRPQKQFLWFLLRRDSARSAGRDVGIDVGCADMANRKFFRTGRYIGLDPDATMLAKGKSRHPDAEAVHATIEDAPPMTGDFVLCLQVFVHRDFPKDRAVAATQRLISMVRPGGVLLMNTGRGTRQYDDQILTLLSAAFAKVAVVSYGNFGGPQAPLPLAIALAALMYAVPPLRTAGGHQKTYFQCVGRRGPEHASNGEITSVHEGARLRGT